MNKIQLYVNITAINHSCVTIYVRDFDENSTAVTEQCNVYEAVLVTWVTLSKE